MRSASSKHVVSCGLLSLLLASGAAAAPLISQWDVQSVGNREQISLRWTEAGPYEVTRFPEAGQYVVVIPGASVTKGVTTSLDTSGSLLLDRARLHNITMPNGEAGVQLTLQLSRWTNVEESAGEQGLVFSMDLHSELRPTDVLNESGKRRLELTDEKVRELGSRPFGSPQAPATGAGQIVPASSGGINDFYVPVEVDESIRRGNPSHYGMGEAAIDARLNEIVDRVDFQGTTLENVLRLIAEEAELNFLISPEHVQGRTVTLRLREVTLRHMLDALLKSNNLGYTVEPGGIINVVPRDRIKSTQRETITETISINWVSAADIGDALEDFVDDKDGVLQVIPHSNQIIIRDVPENVRAVQDMINLIDIPEKQVLMELRLVNMTETATRAMGVRTGFVNREIKEMIDVDSISFDETGETTFSGVGVSETFGSAGLLAPVANPALSLTQLGSIGIFGNRFDVEMELNALEIRGEAVTLANPTVLSLNNVEARVEIERLEPYVSAISATEGAVATIQFKPIGTRVTVLPRITPNGYVQMRIQPEQQLLARREQFEGGSVPVTDERRVEASVIVKDEQTIALGGLRQFESSADESGVPYLLRVPILSWLFKNQSNAQTRTEMYLFVTPHIIKDPTPTSYQQALYEKIDYNWDLPDYYFDEMFARKAPGEVPPAPYED